MFALLRESLGIVELSDSVTKLVIDSLAKISMGEGDFCRIVLEVIAEIHDTIAEDEEDETQNIGDGDDSFHSAKSSRGSSEVDSDIEDTITVKGGKRVSNGKKHKAKRQKTDHKRDDRDVEMLDSPTNEEDEEAKEAAAHEKAIRELMVNMKCLHIAQCMLENVEGNLKQNTTLVTMLNGLVVPSVRSHETPVRERGLRCLGLSCLLDRTLAEENLALFAHCFNKGHENLRIEALHIISDILLCHGAPLFDGESCTVEQRTLYRMFAKALKLEDLDGVQASAAEVICKLMLAQVIQDEEVSPLQ
jgi:condensin complex subunit 3